MLQMLKLDFSLKNAEEFVNLRNIKTSNPLN